MTATTYRELKKALEKIAPEHLDDDITIHEGFSDEYYRVETSVHATDTDVLDEGHPVLHITYFGDGDLD